MDLLTIDPADPGHGGDVLHPMRPVRKTVLHPEASRALYQVQLLLVFGQVLHQVHKLQRYQASLNIICCPY